MVGAVNLQPSQINVAKPNYMQVPSFTNIANNYAAGDKAHPLVYFSQILKNNPITSSKNNNKDRHQDIHSK